MVPNTEMWSDGKSLSINYKKIQFQKKKKSSFRLRYGKYTMNNIIGSIKYFQQVYELVSSVQLQWSSVQQQKSLVLILFFPEFQAQGLWALQHVYSA